MCSHNSNALLSLGCAALNVGIGARVCVSEINFCDETNKIGTIEVTGAIDVCLLFQSGRIYGSASVRELNIVDKAQTLGMNPQALAQFSSFSKELLGKVS